MLNEVIARLGQNYKSDDEQVLNEIISNLTTDALFISNRSEDSTGVLKEEIIEASISTYLLRGSEGLNSLSQAGISNSFRDIKDKMRNDIIKNGKRVIK